MFGPAKWFPARAVANTRTFWRRWLVVGVFLCLVPFVAVAGLRLYSWYLSMYRLDGLASEEVLVESFRGVVHTFESQDPAFTFPVRKWSGEIPVYFDPSLPEWHRSVIRTYVPILENLTGLSFVKAPSFDQDRYLNVLFAKSMPEVETIRRTHDLGAQLVADFEGTNCYVIADTAAVGNKIGRLVVYKLAQDHPIARSCILEELVQALGLPADRATYGPSLFSDFTDPLDIPLNDKILIRALYDPTIKPGMTAEQTRALVPDIIHRLVTGVKARGEAALYQQ